MTSPTKRAAISRFTFFASDAAGLPPQQLTLRIAILTLLCASATAAEQPAVSTTWQTGPAFVKQLAQPVSLTWGGAPIDGSLQRLSEATHMAILLDRRVDPSRAIQLSVDQLPLRQVVAKIAEELELGDTTLDAIIYIGPTTVARQLRTLSSMQHASANRLSATRKRAVLERRRWTWERFATPQMLLADLERESGVKISGQERVPHDLLRGADLPAIPWIDRLLLLAAEFNLRVELKEDGAEARLLPMVDMATITRAYPAKGSANDQAAKWRALAPEAEIKVEGERVVVTGRVEDHELIGHGGQLPGASEQSERRWLGMTARNRKVASVRRTIAPPSARRTRLPRPASKSINWRSRKSRCETCLNN
jgi:hypothetical protein